MSDKKLEKALVEQFTRDLENLTEKKKNELLVANDDDYRQVLELAKMMLKTDWSGSSKIKDSLKKRLETHLFNEEISDEDLDWVAGGLHNPEYRGSKKEGEE